MKLVVHFDGGSRGNPGPAGAGVVVQDAQGRAVYEAGFFLGRMTNNMAEYSGLVRGLDAAVRAKAREVSIFADSELVVRQLNGDYRVKDAKLRDLFDEALVRLRTFERWTIRHIPREQNHRADELANLAMDAGEDVVVLDVIAAVSKPEAPRKSAADKAVEPRPRKSRSRVPPEGESTSPQPSPTVMSSARTDADARIVVARCVKTPDAAVCPAPCSSGAEFIFDRTVPAGLCLDLAAQVLRAVEAVRKSGRPAKVFCSHEACGACLEIRLR